MGVLAYSVTMKVEIGNLQFSIIDVPSPAVCGLPMVEASGVITLHCSLDAPSPIQKSIELLKDLQ